MRYFTYIEMAGLYLRTLGLEDQVAVVHRDGQLIDVSVRAAERKIKRSLTLQEAKMILLDQAVYAEYEEPVYKSAAERWLNLLLKYSGIIQPVSPASAFLDLSSHPRPEEIAALLLHELYLQEKLPIRAGIAPSRWLAELSSQGCDPLALKMGVLPIEPVLDPKAWLADKQVSCLIHLPIEIRRRLPQLGIRFVRDIQELPQEALRQHFRKNSTLIRAVSEGRYTEPVHSLWPEGSFNCERILDRCESALELDDAFQKLSAETSARLCEEDVVANGLHVFVSLESNRILQDQRKLKHPIQTASEIQTQVRQLLGKMDIQEPVEHIRLFLTELKRSVRRQTMLAFTLSKDPGLLDSAMNRIQNAFGGQSLILGSQVKYSREQAVLKAWKEAYGWK